MSVAITGANGFIGSALKEACIKQGITVIGLCRNPVEFTPGPADNFTPEIRFDLNNTITFTHIPSDVKTLIHTAYTTQAKDLRQAYLANVTGSLALFDYCHTKNIRVIFLSSCSAHVSARSFYGRSKYQLEKHLSPNDTIIRPGFVVGNGGIYLRLEHTMRTLRFAPLFWGGQQPLQVIQLDDLVTGILNALQQNHTGAYNLVYSTPYLCREFYRQIFIKQKLKPRFLRLPGDLTLRALKIAEFLKIPLPLTSENLLGLKHLKTFESDCAKLGVNPKPF